MAKYIKTEDGYRLLTELVDIKQPDQTYSPESTNAQSGIAVAEAIEAAKIVTSDGTVISENADYAEVGEWADGNTNNENRIGYFVAIDDTTPGTTMVKAKSSLDVRGVTVIAPAFSGNCSADKFNDDKTLKQQYDYVAVMGIVSVIDNGTCTINGRCMPDDNGCAIPSSNNMGYQVIDRIDDTHVLIAIEPSADMIQRIKSDINELYNTKVDKVDGKGLSTNDYTTEEKNKLAGVTYGAEPNIQSNWNQNDETTTDYIKNRPFYEYEGLTITEITTYEQANEAKTQYNNGTLKVVINGVEYTDFAYTSGTYSWTLSTSDSAYSMTGGYMNQKVTFTPSDAVWMLHANTTKVVQLDEKYIPDTIARDADKMNAHNPSGTGSFSMNRKADTTIGSYSSTIGRNNTASGKYSHAEGENSVASGDCSHAEGSTSQAYGEASHAEGRYAIARGNYSHAEGGYVEAGSPYQHVQGKNNIIDTESKYAHIVGNGVSNGARNNAHTLDWSGNAWFSGTVKVGGTGQDDTAAKELATKDDIDASKPKSATVTLLAANWVGDTSPYSQVVTINGITANSRIDLQPTPEQLSELQNKDAMLMIANDNGITTAYILNYKPIKDYEIQISITEMSK